jgi:hypothetical protein
MSLNAAATRRFQREQKRTARRCRSVASAALTEANPRRTPVLYPARVQAEVHFAEQRKGVLPGTTSVRADLVLASQLSNSGRERVVGATFL